MEATAAGSLGKVNKFFTSIGLTLVKQTLKKLNTDDLCTNAKR